MSMNVNIDETWMPEPELMEAVPRRVVAFDEFPDRNRPNVTIFGGISGALLAAGFGLFGLAITNRWGSLPLVIGILLLIVGGAGLVYFPYKLRQHIQRTEHLVTNGTPVMARLLSADNLGGDTYTRSVKYQVSLPGGDLDHREINIDDRVLPKRIPSNTTALMDMASGDVEIYIALPFRAVLRSAPIGSAVASATIPMKTPQEMGTINVANAPEIKREKPKDETPQPKRETFE